ncbi:MAG: hypothetical protein COY66_06290 [Candidatus Kerfeldbacteria bacterium CG_4_10_14_0_8_um_filter_42_10]|uniref:Lycopene cyclase domain-containing protein n=1 Tax=Candidatus Kerfeldbacteria bacterium CG_4_10_14_0_8_um_filter_42_10 TaxID=2014248 RepID=A0A2M7RFV4_9BACT|nr:MAG: hypothetical protein COY66_06290 [Candidatus Kerfeldbacteria bacterium CG_4_10_14_0_8_um_filter_42_10]
MKRFLFSLAYIFLLGVPAAILFYFIKEDFNCKALFIVILISLIVGGIFEIWAVKQRRRDKFFIWEYNSKSIIGFKIYGVPIEDLVLFLIFTPFFIVTVWESVKRLLVESEELFSVIMLVGVIALFISWYFVYQHAIKSKY